MLKKLLKTNRGALLFEAFVALMILSIGITGTLRVFSEALYAGTQNRDRSMAKVYVEGLLFGWFAHPSGANLQAGGKFHSEFGSEAGNHDFGYALQSQLLTGGATSDGEEAIEEPQGLQIEKTKNQYFRIEVNVLKEQKKNILDIEVVLAQPVRGPS